MQCFQNAYLFRKKSCNWRNYNEKLKFSDAKNTRKIKQKSSETKELEVDEQSENKPSSSDTVIDFVQETEGKPSASTSSAENPFSHVSESKTWI